MGDSTVKVEDSAEVEEQRRGGSSWEWLYDKKISTQDLSRTVLQSTDSAIRSARSLQHNSSKLFQSLQDFVPQAKFHYKTYEDAFFKKVRDELVSAREHPAVAGGVVVTAGLLLMRGPRRFLFRHTFGRLQNEEAQFVRADKNVKELNLSVNLMKKESRKLLERATLAEAEMKRGLTDLMVAGSQIQSLAKSLYKVEAEAVGERRNVKVRRKRHHKKMMIIGEEDMMTMKRTFSALQCIKIQKGILKGGLHMMKKLIMTIFDKEANYEGNHILDEEAEMKKDDYQEGSSVQVVV